ncbi:helix-turn-helix domain-containing protein [Pseudomonas sp. NPDC090755]|uniref:helix-turn-helix domain-containing protein n=1 Tax=Pseudomonas sp. NPDC090755 TaxID=3364481 RepID=UPI00383B1272
MSTNGFAAVLHRMKQVTATRTDTELSCVLDVSPQTLSSWKSRDSIPYSVCIDLAARHGVSLDWLLLGQEPQPAAPAAHTASAEPIAQWEVQLLTQMRTLSRQDQQAIAQAVDEKRRLRQLERQVEELSRHLHPRS